MSKKYNVRRELLIECLQSIKGINLVHPQGAFYAFPKLPNGSPDSITFCKLALEEVGLALVPGAAFGDDNCVRLSCAVPSKVIQDGVERMKQLIAKINK